MLVEFVFVCAESWDTLAKQMNKPIFSFFAQNRYMEEIYKERMNSQSNSWFVYVRNSAADVSGKVGIYK